MFGRWKKKIRDFLFEEQEEQEDDQQRETWPKKHDIQTHMTYQYPKRKAWRFPVIPDEAKENKQADIPAFQRQQRQTDDVHIQKDTTNTQAAPQPPQKRYKPESSEPFKPSDVPSPVHGFQRRDNEEALDEDINEDSVETTNSDSSEEPEEEAEAATNEASADADTSSTVNGGDDTLPVFHQQTSVTQDTSHNEPTPQSESGETTSSAQEDASQSNKMSQPAKDSTSKRRSRQSVKRQSGSQPPPFNVLMSANDKRNQTKRRQERHRLSQTRTNAILRLLGEPEPKTDQDQQWLEQARELLDKTLKYFRVQAEVVNTTQGPSITRFEVQPELGVKVSKIKNLSDDLKLNMAAEDIRIEAPIPGKRTVGIEVPNRHPRIVSLKEIFTNATFQTDASPLSVGLGLNIEGDPLVTNIRKMPHGLIAGATGSGKSVCINTILISLIYKASHENVKLMLIDPKMVELAPYNGIPHLISPVITDVKAATAALKWAVREMEERYEAFVRENVRDIERFNQKMTQQNRPDDKMTFIVIVIDELADLMMIAPQDVEDAISRIAQKARACGIHLLLATQRPSVDVITGLIKANIPTRIAFSVSSQVDSKTILDTGGAERLLGKGDMLFTGNGAGKSIRLQGAFVSDEEIDRVTAYARSIAEPEYQFEQKQLLEHAVEDEETDELLDDAIAFVVDHNSASTSLLQRQFKIGYNRAARLMDAMENRGIIAEQNGSKPREVLVSAAQLEN